MGEWWTMKIMKKIKMMKMKKIYSISKKMNKENMFHQIHLHLHHILHMVQINNIKILILEDFLRLFLNQINVLYHMNHFHLVILFLIILRYIHLLNHNCHTLKMKKTILKRRKRWKRLQNRIYQKRILAH